MRGQSVLAGFEELMVVNITLPPVDGLIVQDVAPLIDRIIVRAPEDTTRMRVLRSEVMIDEAVVPAQGVSVIIPVNRHCKGVTNR